MERVPQNEQEAAVLVEALRMELRRGCLVLAVLAALDVERYGYTLRKALVEKGLEIEESTLYPLLRRLEAQGLLASEWREEARRRKRFYRLSAAGEAILARLLAEWQALHRAMEEVLSGTGAVGAGVVEAGRVETVEAADLRTEAPAVEEEEIGAEGTTR